MQDFDKKMQTFASAFFIFCLTYNFKICYHTHEEKIMLSGVITILLGACAFVMLTQPALAFYGGNNDLQTAIKDFFNEHFAGNTTGYGLLTFEDGQNTFWLLGNIFLIIAMVFCGLMVLFSIINLIMVSAGKDKVIGTRVFAILFFVFALVSVIMYVLFANEMMSTDIEGFIQTIRDGGVVLSVGYGLICFAAASLLSIFFASDKRKKK